MSESTIIILVLLVLLLLAWVWERRGRSGRERVSREMISALEHGKRVFGTNLEAAQDERGMRVVDGVGSSEAVSYFVGFMSEMCLQKRIVLQKNPVIAKTAMEVFGNYHAEMIRERYNAIWQPDMSLRPFRMYESEGIEDLVTYLDTGIIPMRFKELLSKAFETSSGEIRE